MAAWPALVFALFFILPVSAVAQGLLTNGGNHEGVIDPNEEDTWTFEAEAGDRLRCEILME